MHEHLFGVIAGGLGFDHHRLTRTGESREQHRRFQLRRSDRRLVNNRDGVARALQLDGQPVAIAGLDRACTHAREWIEQTAHRARAQTGIAVEGRGDRAARDRADDEAAAGSRIAEIERRGRFAKAADADAVNTPTAFAGPLDLGAQGAHRLAGVDDVFTFKQAGNAGFANRERSDDECAVRNRLVAGHAHAALNRAATAGGEWR